MSRVVDVSDTAAGPLLVIDGGEESGEEVTRKS